MIKATFSARQTHQSSQMWVHQVREGPPEELAVALGHLRQSARTAQRDALGPLLGNSHMQPVGLDGRSLLLPFAPEQWIG